MVGTFIGREGSMGLHNGIDYKLSAVTGYYPLNIRVDSLVTQGWTVVPYATLESFLANWALKLGKEDQS